LKRPPPSRFRRLWALAPGTIFLNHGSFGACPKAILDLQTGLRRQMEAEPVQFLWRRYEELLEPARRAVAQFVGASSKDLVFVTNATTGVNSVMRSLRFKAGDEILTTSHDYNACRNVLAEVAARSGARLVVASVPFPLASEDEVVEAVLGCVTARTRLAMIDHVTSNTALIFPIARLVQELEARSVDTLVDGAHAAGMLPLDLNQLGAAYYTANLHKWTCAPKGAAFLWAREDKQDGLQPAVISHGNNRPRAGFTRFQDRFDWAGTFDVTPWLCVPHAIDFMGSLLNGGWPELRKHNHDLVIKARGLLGEMLDVTAPCPETMLGSMATLPLPEKFQRRPVHGKTAHLAHKVDSPLPKIDHEQLRLYDQYGVEVPLMRIGEPVRRCFRISAQVYNTIHEYEHFGKALLDLEA
jgi:isopenicillin-N epimerase